MFEYIFWISIGLIAYTYLGYPFILSLLSAVKRRPVQKSAFEPHVSVVIAAFNEERTIEWRLQNLIEQDYPREKIEIVVVSDGSTDRTEQIIKEFSSWQRQVRFFSMRERKGKVEALNLGVAQAKGDIIVFTDARQTFRPEAVRHLVANFSDPEVGCVSGELIFIKNLKSLIQSEMGAYWLYEKWIRKAENRTGSTIGATGAIYAIRKQLYKPLPSGTLLDDVLTPMNIVMQGYRVAFDGSAVAYDVPSKDASQEWTRKVRTLAGNWQITSLAPALLSPWKNPCWWRFISHKLMRLAVPFLLPAVLMSGALLSDPIYRVSTSIQMTVYALVLIGFAVPPLRRFRLINIPYFFILLNLAAVVGFWRWITGQSQTVWIRSDKAGHVKKALK